MTMSHGRNINNKGSQALVDGHSGVHVYILPAYSITDEPFLVLQIILSELPINIGNFNFLIGMRIGEASHPGPRRATCSYGNKTCTKKVRKIAPKKYGSLCETHHLKQKKYREGKIRSDMPVTVKTIRSLISNLHETSFGPEISVSKEPNGILIG